MNFGIDKDTSNSIPVAPTLNSKFASELSAKLCELRVRGTRAQEAWLIGHDWSGMAAASEAFRMTRAAPRLSSALPRREAPIQGVYRKVS